MLYRLSGDRNPLHSDPSFAKLAGFPKPILHGLCTYGVTGRALLHGLCGSDPSKFKVMDARFSKPVFPGDTLTVKMWNQGAGKAIFQTVTQEGTVVIDGGIFEYEADSPRLPDAVAPSVRQSTRGADQGARRGRVWRGRCACPC